jgi:hypothetical protein
MHCRQLELITVLSENRDNSLWFPTILPEATAFALPKKWNILILGGNPWFEEPFSPRKL